MARFLNVAAGITLVATGAAAEMMRASDAYKELADEPLANKAQKAASDASKNEAGDKPTTARKPRQRAK